MTFIIIITHMEPNIRHQPLKMSSVFLDPPMPKASGHENENSRYDIPFRHLEAQLDKLPHHDNANNDDQEPRSSNRKIIFIRDGNGDAGGNLKQRNHLR